MQVCTLLLTDNHASTLPLCFLQADALPAAKPTVQSTEAKHYSGTADEQTEATIMVIIARWPLQNNLNI